MQEECGVNAVRDKRTPDLVGPNDKDIGLDVLHLIEGAIGAGAQGKRAIERGERTPLVIVLPERKLLDDRGQLLFRSAMAKHGIRLFPGLVLVLIVNEERVVPGVS